MFTPLGVFDELPTTVGLRAEAPFAARCSPTTFFTRVFACVVLHTFSNPQWGE
jgi:hypothetical protein